MMSNDLKENRSTKELEGLIQYFTEIQELPDVKTPKALTFLEALKQIQEDPTKEMCTTPYSDWEQVVAYFDGDGILMLLEQSEDVSAEPVNFFVELIDFEMNWYVRKR